MARSKSAAVAEPDALDVESTPEQLEAIILDRTRNVAERARAWSVGVAPHYVGVGIALGRASLLSPAEREELLTPFPLPGDDGTDVLMKPSTDRESWEWYRRLTKLQAALSQRAIPLRLHYSLARHLQHRQELGAEGGALLGDLRRDLHSINVLLDRIISHISRATTVRDWPGRKPACLFLPESLAGVYTRLCTAARSAPSWLSAILWERAGAIERLAETADWDTLVNATGSMRSLTIEV